MDNAARLTINHSGHNDTDSFADTDFTMFREDSPDTPAELTYEHCGFSCSWKARYCDKLTAQEIGDEHIGARDSDIDGYYALLASVYVEESGLAAPHAFSGRAFKDQSLSEEIVDDKTNSAASQSHDSREVGARNRLMCSHEIESNLPVYLARSTTRSNMEVIWIDSPHCGDVCPNL